MVWHFGGFGFRLGVWGLKGFGLGLCAQCMGEQRERFHALVQDEARHPKLYNIEDKRYG